MIDVCPRPKGSAEKWGIGFAVEARPLGCLRPSSLVLRYAALGGSVAVGDGVEELGVAGIDVDPHVGFAFLGCDDEVPLREVGGVLEQLGLRPGGRLLNRDGGDASLQAFKLRACLGRESLGETARHEDAVGHASTLAARAVRRCAAEDCRVSLTWACSLVALSQVIDMAP